MAKKTKILVTGSIVILLFIAIYFSQSLSILGVSNIQLGKDGKPQWVFFVRPSGEGEEITLFSPNPDEMGTYEDNKGGTYVPQYEFRIYLEPQQMTCTYDLYENEDWFDSVTDWIKFWEEDFEYYAVSESFERSAPIKITTSKSTEPKYIDGFETGKTLTFNDQRDGEGKITIQSQGALAGKYDCVGTGGDLAVTLGKESGQLQYWFDKDPRDAQLSREERPSWSRGYECDITQDKTQLICKRGITDLGSGTLTITADAEYLDYRYYPPTQGTPKIRSISSQAILKQNTYGSIKVVVENIGDNAGLFTLEGTGEITIVPSTTTVTLSPGEKKDVYFSMIAPQVTTQSTKEGSFKMCTTDQFGSSTCTSKDFSVKVTKEEPDSDYCGDNICSLNEDYTNCPTDCGNVPTCNGNHMLIEEGLCTCEDGYSMTQDEFGREYCTQSITPIIIIVGIFIVIVLFMVLIKKRRR